jgi:pimeloyl-ACP methyl ester carboxylesterase
VSSITTDQGSVHYEVFGKGRPVLLLHGYQGSWGLWEHTMTALGAAYRMYALDFWGFGESGAMRSSYALGDFVSLVEQFMEQLGIRHAPVVGHSMGGTVGLMVALRRPQRVEKIAVIGAPIDGSSLFFFPRVFGYRLVAWFTFHNLWIYRGLYRLLARRYSRDPRWTEIMDRDVSRTNLHAFFASIGSLRHTNLSPRLPDMRPPVLGMYGGRDNVVDPNQWTLLQRLVPRSQIEQFPNAGHFIMLDEPAAFLRTLKGFLDGPLAA